MRAAHTHSVSSRDLLLLHHHHHGSTSNLVQQSAAACMYVRVYISDLPSYQQTRPLSHIGIICDPPASQPAAFPAVHPPASIRDESLFSRVLFA